MLPKLGLYVCGLLLAGYSGYAAYEYNLGVGGNDVFAAAMAVLTGANVLLAYTVVVLWRNGYRRMTAVGAVAWSVILTVLLANSAGFTVGNRRTVATGKDTEIASRARDQQAYDETVSALAQAHKDALWTETSACADARKKVQHTFCTRVSQLEADESRLSADLRKAPPASRDVQGEWLAPILGRSSQESGAAASIAAAVVLEVAASTMLLFGELLPWPAWLRWPAKEASSARVEPALEAPVKRRRRAKTKRHQDQPRKRKQEVLVSPTPKPPLRLVIGDKL